MNELEGIRQLPHSLQAEQAVLGALIIDPEKLADVAELTTEDLYPETHKVIFSAIKNLYIQSRGIDVVTLVDEIKRAFGDTDFDAAKYIKTICDVAVENTNISEHVRIIIEKSILRKLIEASREISDKAFSETGDVKHIVQFSEDLVFRIADERYHTELTPISDTIKENYRHYEFLSRNPEAYGGMKTGYSQLDRYFVSLGEGDLVLIGARPGVGKTTLALNLALNMGLKYPEKEIAIFSLEMSKEQLVNRLVSCQSLIDNYTVKKASFTGDQWGELADACSTLSKTRIYLDDTTNITVTDIMTKVRRLKDPGIIIIDYLQLMQGETHKENRVLEVGDITRSLKILAKEMKVPVLLVSQLSRPPKNSKEKRPQLLSEFGGYVRKLPEHSFNTEKTYGYRTFATREAYIDALRALYRSLIPLAKEGLCGAIYTQVSDVEDETNGLFTFDRAVLKVR
ncbi:MAG: replicative DNA helicase, partial [Clostridia bacterium]|nr:replicative DNA helicase [Clostridia bacterium]